MRNAWLSVVVWATAFAAGTAQAAVLVVGAGNARLCYTAAASGRDDLESVRTCNMALTEQMLSSHDRAATLVNRGIIQLGRNNAEQALADFDRAVDVMPDLAEVHTNRAAALLYLNRYHEALAAADRAIALNPEEPERAYFIRAAANEELGNMTAAYRDYSRAVELAPTWRIARAELARFRVGS